MKTVINLFKLRIGVVITFTALAAAVITPGAPVSVAKMLVLGVAVLIASASAGAFNQYVERDLDARMARTSRRPFVTGALVHDARWLWLIMALTAAAVLAAGWALNPLSALYVFLGAFFYAIVYTVWLKSRTWMNIVVGGLSGSFAVLAGAAAVAPGLPPEALILALVLFLWTPPHFWSLAIAYRDDYVAARVPMLPAVIGAKRCANVVLANAVLLVAVSIVPVFFGSGPIYLAGAVSGGAFFIFKAARLAREPSRRNAMASFFASMAQLSLLLVGWMIEAALR